MAKREPLGPQTLSSRWCPPVELPQEIEEAGGPVACVASTFTFHAQFFEAELLPRFLGLRYDTTEGERPFIVERERALGTARVCVLVDQDHFDPTQTTLRWDQIPIDVPGGIQHSKVTLLAWERWVRLIVGSANLTREGYRRNRELVGVLDFFNGESSAPRQMALEAMDFLEAVLEWARGAEEGTTRVRRILDEVRNRLRRWVSMPAAFTPRETPRAAFVAGLAAREGRRARSVMTQLQELWGTRRASEVVVMTPFVGDIEGDTDPVVDALTEFPLTREARGALVVPGWPSEGDGSKMLVNLPKRFLTAWANAWGVRPVEVPTYVVPLCRDAKGEKVNRDLHAKAILLVGDGLSLLMSGSSNFTPHGMGVGQSNIEANLCYLDTSDTRRGGLTIRDRLPVDWDADHCEDTVWPDTTKAAEDQPGSQPRLPAAFLWATYDQVAGQIALGLDPKAVLPEEWSLHLPGERAGEVPAIIDHHRLPTIPENGCVVVVLPEAFRSVMFAALRLTWRESDGKIYSGMLGVQIRDSEALLPPEEFRAITADRIIECLIAGRDPAEWVESQMGQGARGKAEVKEAIDSLRAVDTTGYVLYRIRRLGRALTVLGERVLKTVRTRDAMAYRLRQDPLGPGALAEALRQEWSGSAASGSGAPARTSPLAFGLGEIALCVAHAGRRVHGSRSAGEPDLRPLFRNMVCHLAESWEKAMGEKEPAGSNLRSYLSAVRQECDRLLGGAEKGENHAG